MRASPRRSGLLAAAVIAMAATIISPVGADTGDAIGRLIAEQFSKSSGSNVPRGTVRRVEPAVKPAPGDEQRIIEEIDMLERARAEAESRRDALLKEREAAEVRDGERGDPVQRADVDRRIEEETLRAAEAAQRAAAARQTEEERRIATERRRQEEAERAAEAARKAAEDRRIAEERRAAEEARAAETARRVEEERRIAEERRAEDGRRAAEAVRRAEEERRAADQRQAAEQTAKAEAHELALMEAEREAEADRIDEALRKARESRETRNSPHYEERAPWPRTEDSASTGSHQAIEDTGRGRSGERLQADRAGSTQVTVLMAMVPGNRGIRRNNKTADPILCGERGCYVSAGPAAPAALMPMRRAFGPGRTLGERAGACRNSLTCVFRNVDLVAYPAVLQPVDMRLIRHDRRQPQVLQQASDCRVDGGRLSCSPVAGPDYTIWVVPQEIADAVGSAELERVVDEGLQQRNAAAWHQVRD